MISVCITVEGRTELHFVKQILSAHLGRHGIMPESRCVLSGRDNSTAREFRGGLTKYHKARKDILNWIKCRIDSTCYFATMFDYYALPHDFPGYEKAQAVTAPYERVAILEQALADDINHPRFIPYIQLHEFEALLLAAPRQLNWEYLEHDKAIANLVKMAEGKNPELINDGHETAPSKRILKEIPEFDKATSGVAVAKEIGLPKLREQCLHFDEWITKLEQLAS